MRLQCSWRSPVQYTPNSHACTLFWKFLLQMMRVENTYPNQKQMYPSQKRVKGDLICAWTDRVHSVVSVWTYTDMENEKVTRRISSPKQINQMRGRNREQRRKSRLKCNSLWSLTVNCLYPCTHPPTPANARGHGPFSVQGIKNGMVSSVVWADGYNSDQLVIST